MPKLFAPPKHSVLSLTALADTEASTPPRIQSQMEVLVRHLLHRFFHNELLGSDDETKRVMQIGYAVALPGLVVALYLFPAYHAFPPLPYPRPFWPQVSDHYFYVMYALVIMGAATVYEWDLLFPDLLDVFVLSILPIPNRRLFVARVLALVIFLTLVLLGTSIFGIVTLPLVADLPHRAAHFIAHAVAVATGGAFAAATFLAAQGILLNTIGERLFRRITPLLQGGSLMLLLTILLLFPAVSVKLQPLLTSGSPVVRGFPPFWYLGIYQRLLDGPSALPIFHDLARTGVYALLLMMVVTVLTYPLAYRRRVRQIVEGATATRASKRTSTSLNRLLHATLIRTPAARATFHFIGQTLFRSPRHRLVLAMYGGLALALTLANMVVIHISGRHVWPEMLPDGIRAAVPIMAFWTVTALQSAIAAPVDRRGAWLFRVLIGRANADHLAGVRIWITTCAAAVAISTELLLHGFAPASFRAGLATVAQGVVAVGVSTLLSDWMLSRVRRVPFTYLRISAVSDFPLMILRYFVLFPILVGIVLHEERLVETSATHLAGAACLLAGTHMLLVHLQRRSVGRSTLDIPGSDADDFPQGLGLRET